MLRILTKFQTSQQRFGTCQGVDLGTYVSMIGNLSSDSIPGEIIDGVLAHLDGHWGSLRACTLICSSWRKFARCHLLRTVVCRPDAPHLSPRDLSTFLSSASDIIPYVCSLKVVGGKPASEVEVAVEDVLPLLSTLPNLNSLLFERVPLFTRARPHDSPIEVTPLPATKPLTVSLCAIRYTDSTDAFFRALKDGLGPRSVHASLKFSSCDDHSSLPAFLNILGPNITQLSCNLLGSVGDAGMLAGGPSGEVLIPPLNIDR